MDLIDDQGRLFGVVNVVDAMVVLVVLALLVAGVALVTAGDGEPTDPSQQPPERFATVTYDVPVGSEAATVSAGDRLRAINGQQSYAVADTYRSFTPTGTVSVVATLRYRGSLTAGEATLYGGSTVDLRTDAYRVDAAVVAVNGTDSSVPTTTRRVVLVANVSTTVADAVESGATGRIGGEQVATVTALERRDAGGSHTRLLVGAELTVLDGTPVPAFGGRPLRVGNRVTIVTDAVSIPGRLATVGTDDPATVSDG